MIDAASTTVSTLAGSGSYGYLDGPVASARFAHPRGVAVDAQSRVYVADTNSSTIRLIDNGVVTTFAGVAALCSTNCDGGRCPSIICPCVCGSYSDGPVAQASFRFPWNLAVDASGRKVYVADTVNRRIRLIEGGVVNTVAGSGTSGALDGPASLARFTWPTALVLTAQGVLYVADYDTFSIRRIADGNVTTAAGTTDGYLDGGVDTAMLRPYGLSVAPTGELIFGDVGGIAIPNSRQPTPPSRGSKSGSRRSFRAPESQPSAPRSRPLPRWHRRSIPPSGAAAAEKRPFAAIS